MINKDELKTIIETLKKILSSLEEFTPCSKCTKPAAARGFCSKHYSQWRREYCREQQIKKLSDQPKIVEPDPRQTQLFASTRPDLSLEQLFTKLEF